MLVAIPPAFEVNRLQQSHILKQFERADGPAVLERALGSSADPVAEGVGLSVHRFLGSLTGPDGQQGRQQDYVSFRDRQARSRSSKTSEQRFQASSAEGEAGLIARRLYDIPPVSDETMKMNRLFD